MTKNKLSFLITGDFCPHRRIENKFRKHKYNEVFNDFLKYSQNSDVVITNLECPLTRSDKLLKKTGPNLKAHPECIKGIKFAGFNIVTLANNHIMDYRKKGLDDTVRILKNNNIDYVGVGSNINEARKGLFKRIKDKTISIINICESEWSIAYKNKAGANPLDPINNYYQIKKAKNKSDFLILIIHGGHENFKYPSPRMIKTYRFFADSGADIIIGHHSHMASGFEIYNNVPIYYSLGNFIFDWQQRKSFWYKGYFVTFKLNNNDKIENLAIQPYNQCRIKPKLEIIKSNKDNYLKSIKKISKEIKNPTNIENKFKEFCKDRGTMYLASISSLNKLQRIMIRNKFLRNLIIRKKNIRRILNLVRCESHRDCLKNSLISFLLGEENKC